MDDFNFISTAGENPFSSLKPEVHERGNSGPAWEGKKERSQNANFLFFRSDFSSSPDCLSFVVNRKQDWASPMEGVECNDMEAFITFDQQITLLSLSSNELQLAKSALNCLKKGKHRPNLVRFLPISSFTRFRSLTMYDVLGFGGMKRSPSCVRSARAALKMPSSNSLKRVHFVWSECGAVLVSSQNAVWQRQIATQMPNKLWERVLVFILDRLIPFSQAFQECLSK